MTQQRINELRMADALWENYCGTGLWVDLQRYRSPTGRASDQAEALRRTALNTYVQFCAKHGIDTGYIYW